jgi:hypothetical protein
MAAFFIASAVALGTNGGIEVRLLNGKVVTLFGRE